VLEILHIPDTQQTTKSQVAEAILQWDAAEFEQEATNRGMCVSAYRSFDEWDKHPQAATLVGKPPLTITRISATSKCSIPQRTHPLQGFRVLDLSRVLAGPMAGRTLAGRVSSSPY
jgi:crotonobetainyl-CoA:carnitine CoA-transferase CaiB-like acyl-CoA transferase